MPRYMFRIYDEDAVFLRTEVEERPNDAAARSRAGTFAKTHYGPVDLAFDGESDRDWAERYITTISPSEYHAAGWRAERLT